MCNGLDGRDGNAWSGLLSTGYFLPTIPITLGLIFYDAWQLSAVTEEEGPRKVLYPNFPHLFQCAVLLRSRYHLAVPPGDAHYEVQLLLRMALCAVPCAGFHLQLLPTSS